MVAPPFLSGSGNRAYFISPSILYYVFAFHLKFIVARIGLAGADLKPNLHFQKGQEILNKCSWKIFIFYSFYFTNFSQSENDFSFQEVTNLKKFCLFQITNNALHTSLYHHNFAIRTVFLRILLLSYVFTKYCINIFLIESVNINFRNISSFSRNNTFASFTIRYKARMNFLATLWEL